MRTNIFQKSHYRLNTNIDLNQKKKYDLILQDVSDYLFLLLGRAQSNPLRGAQANYLQAARVLVGLV